MKQLNILPLTTHLKFNKAQLVHKIYHDKTPPYLKSLINKAPSRYDSTNILPPKPRIDLFKTSFKYSGAHIWNSLPPELHKIESLHTFKNKLHSFLLNDDS